MITENEQYKLRFATHIHTQIGNTVCLQIEYVNTSAHRPVYMKCEAHWVDAPKLHCSYALLPHIATLIFYSHVLRNGIFTMSRICRIMWIQLNNSIGFQCVLYVTFSLYNWHGCEVVGISCNEVCAMSNDMLSDWIFKAIFTKVFCFCFSFCSINKRRMRLLR